MPSFKNKTRFLLFIRIFIPFLCIASGCEQLSPTAPTRLSARAAGEEALYRAYRQGQSDLWVEAEATVIRLLPDDLEGDRHQKFIVQMKSGQTLLISHNIDIAPRIETLKVGDKIQFRGEYEWNPKGGVVHWTHKDPDFRHQGGWIKHGNITYN